MAITDGLSGVMLRHKEVSYGKFVGMDGFDVMGFGFTALDEKPSAQTSDKRYINQASKTKSVTGYDWSTDFTADQIRSEKVINALIKIGEEQLTGADAEGEYVIVDTTRKDSAKSTTFYARQLKVAAAVSEFANNDGEKQVSGSLLGVGDVVVGTFDTATKKFTPATGTGVGA